MDDEENSQSSSTSSVLPVAINTKQLRPNLNPLRRLRIPQRQISSVESESTNTTRALAFRPNLFRRKNHRSSSVIPNTISYENLTLDIEGSTIGEGGDPTEDSSLRRLVLRSAGGVQKPPLPTGVTKIAIIHADSLPAAITLWFECVKSLWQTREFQMVVQSSMLVLEQSKQTAWTVLVMPIVVPRDLCVQATQIVVQSATQVLSEHQERHDNPLHPLVLPSLLFGITTKLVFSMVSPVLLRDSAESVDEEPNKQKICKTLDQPIKKLNDDPYPDYLDKLRLDFGLPSGVHTTMHHPKDCLQKNSDKLGDIGFMHPAVSKGTSKYLLRVDDLDIHEPTAQVAYIDLETTADTRLDLVRDALERLVTKGLGMASTNQDIPLTYESTVSMHWHAEGATKRFLRKIDSEPDLLSRETLVWSGRADCCRQHPFFLARGSIPMSPRALLQLLWDNTRTGEYNNFCMGRTTMLSVGEDDADAAILINGAQSATKVIKSEMKVPFAGFTVRAICLMHAVPLHDGTGYAILSRTLDAGEAGNHLVRCGSAVDRGHNEILWGCNILRRTGSSSSSLHTDLISMSQVGSNVPGFLSQKIGLMGISDFFRNVRTLC